MKKEFLPFAFSLIAILSLCSCNNTENNSNNNQNITNGVITNYYMNDNGDIICEYKNGGSKNLGALNEDLINSIGNVAHNDSLLYIFNGIQTTIPVINSFKATFMNGENNVHSVQRVMKGDKLKEPDEPVLKGNTFIGWYQNDVKWDFNNTISSDITLIPHYDLNTYKISFNTDGAEEIEPLTVTYSKPFTLPKPIRTGYEFIGWLNGYRKFEDGDYLFDQDITLKADWEPIAYYLDLDAKDGTFTGDKRYIIRTGENYNLPIPKHKYGVFEGWFIDGVKVTDEYGDSLKPWDYLENKVATIDWSIDINSVEDLKNINTKLRGYYSLDCDLDLTSTPWTPLGNPNTPFEGVFDGNGHTIKGLTIDSNYEFSGLFGFTANVYIRNLNLVDCNINIPIIEKRTFIGSLIGQARETTIITNCSTSGKINVQKHSTEFDDVTGGYIGYADDVKLQNCTNNINVNSTTSGAGFIASTKKASFTSCINKGTITSSIYVGGLAADTDTINVNRCLNKAKITGNSNKGVGGLVGASNYATIKSSINKGDVINNSTNVDYISGIGGLIGKANSKLEIADCYNIGNITSYGALCGGLVGGFESTNNMFIKNSYNVGSLMNDKYVQTGGIIGIAYGGKIIQCGSFGAFSSSQATPLTYTIGALQVNAKIADCYYKTGNQATTTQGTLTDAPYSETLYTESMFWKKYDPETKTGEWDFHDNAYPTLHWESELLK